MTTEVTDDHEQQRYEISEDGDRVGFLTYRLQPGQIEFIHTEIDPDHGGRGLAGVLVEAALEDAGSRRLVVLPTCPYVARFIGEHSEFLELVPENRRDQFRLAG